MRFYFVAVLALISFSANAQWYRVDLTIKKEINSLKKHERLPLIQPSPIARHYTAHLIATPVIKTNKPSVLFVHLSRSRYSYEAAEASVMHSAQHNMSEGIFTDASYNFSDLARIYIQQNRLSEAKWYLLQSNNISRRQRDDKHTISNLIDLAMIKANIGDCSLAQQDLTEAYTIASLRGYNEDMAEIQKRMKDIKQDQVPMIRKDIRYLGSE